MSPEEALQVLLEKIDGFDYTWDEVDIATQVLKEFIYEKDDE